MVVMITPSLLDEMLTVLRKHNAMSAHIESHGDRIAVTLGPELPTLAADPEPGAWKSQPSDPHDPDPLQLGLLDAPLSFDDEDVAP